MDISLFSIRAARKAAHLSGKLLGHGATFSNRVEAKATRMLNGIDFSMQTAESVSIDKMVYSAIPHILPIHASMPAVGSKPNVTLLIPSLDSGSFFGGTATALVVAAKFALALDRKLRIVQTLKTGHVVGLQAFFESEGVAFDESNIQIISIAERSYNRYGYISTHREDLFIASAWWDAKNLSEMPLAQKFIYLIQDFEPIFYNNSDHYVLAEETYRTDRFIPLCNTEIMADFMKEKGYKAFGNPTFFEPAVSRAKTGLLKQKSKGEKRVLFLYGRPTVHRNMFYTAIQALDMLFAKGILKGSEWDCYMAGQNNLPDIKLSSGMKIVNKGKMSMSDYIKFSKTVDLAVSPMMAPHPNYPTLEFCSIGSMVVTTKYANKQSLDRYSKNIVLTDLNTKSMAEGIKKAAEVSDKTRQDNLTSTKVLESWDSSLDKSVASVLGLLSK